MDQQLVDYTVRNITTGDEEDLRVLELADDEIDLFPDAVRDHIRELILWCRRRTEDGFDMVVSIAEWDTTQEEIRNLLLPYISDRELYDTDYATWEEHVLGIADEVLVEKDKARASTLLLLDSRPDFVKAEPILDRYPPEDVSYRVRQILAEAVDAAIENWQEGYWADFTEATTVADVWGNLAGFIQSYVELEPDELSVRFMGPELDA